MSLTFKLHVIPPPFRLDWRSPRRLMLYTLGNHLIQDQAPIGHYFIEFNSNTPNAYGVKHVLTGMSRKNANQSTLAMIKEQVGLGTVFYDFEGKLDHALKGEQELEWARSKNRLKTIVVPITQETSDVLMNELENWIIHSSFKHYGGGHDILKGEGSGCAEFGVHFLNLALGLKAGHPDWIRRVFVPKIMTGGPKTGKRIPFSVLLFNAGAWALDAHHGYPYQTPDMDLTMDWLEKTHPGAKEIKLEPKDISWSKEKVQRISFQVNYEKASSDEIKKQFSRIELKP